MSNVICNIIMRVESETSKGTSFQEYRSRRKSNTVLAKTTKTDSTANARTFSYIPYEKSVKDG